jgi:hypothetical protein
MLENSQISSAADNGWKQEAPMLMIAPPDTREFGQGLEARSAARRCCPYALMITPPDAREFLNKNCGQQWLEARSATRRCCPYVDDTPLTPEDF